MRILALCVCTAACLPGLDGNSDAGTELPPSQEAQAWLDTQNAVRKAPQPPPPSPLPALTWSSDAAAVAQAWAANCVYQHNAGRGQRGENIAASAPPGHWALGDAVAAWAGEVKDYDYTSNTCASGQQCGHYTQIVWATTLRVGCAHQICNANSPFACQSSWDYFVCDYEPPGNYVGQKPY